MWSAVQRVRTLVSSVPGMYGAKTGLKVNCTRSSAGPVCKMPEACAPFIRWLRALSPAHEISGLNMLQRAHQMALLSVCWVCVLALRRCCQHSCVSALASGPWPDGHSSSQPGIWRQQYHGSILHSVGYQWDAAGGWCAGAAGVFSVQQGCAVFLWMRTLDACCTSGFGRGGCLCGLLDRWGQAAAGGIFACCMCVSDECTGGAELQQAS